MSTGRSAPAFVIAADDGGGLAEFRDLESSRVEGTLVFQTVGCKTRQTHHVSDDAHAKFYGTSSSFSRHFPRL